MRANVTKYVWHEEQSQRLETPADLPLFLKVIVEHFALFYKFTQVSEMFFLSRNNAVEHVAVEQVFAFSLVSENYCFKYEGQAKKAAICIGTYCFPPAFKEQPTENTLGSLLRCTLSA